MFLEQGFGEVREDVKSASKHNPPRILQSRIETVTDDSDLEEIYNTERHLLYVACTRARDYLLVTSAEPASEFLDDLQISHS